MLGVAPTGDPVAEMWVGAHPAGPSVLSDGRRLDAAIEAAPDEFLGPELRRRFGARLPFLMKLLAAAEPLSLQVHPSSERARIRFEEEATAGIPVDAPHRNYRDSNHKPELIYALTRFEGMAGLRDPAKTAQILRILELPWLTAVASRIETTQTPFQTLRAVVTELLATSEPLLGHRLEQLHVAARATEQRLHSSTAGRRVRSQDPSAVERESIRICAAMPPLIEKYPNDAGVLVTLLLNHVVLAAGEAMFIDAGVIHAYTSGFGVEVMSSSDNVLRAGLTPKHVDIPELLEITNFTPMPPPLWAGSPRGAAETVFAPPVSDFELRVVQVSGSVRLAGQGPRIVLCTDGVVGVSSGGCVEQLAAGQTVFIAGAASACDLTGRGTACVALAPA